MVLPLALVLTGCVSTPPPPAAAATWRGVHLWVDKESSAQELIRSLPALSAVGVNVLIIEVNYSFDYTSHPELRLKNFITRETAAELGRAAKANGIRLIPEFNCMGHQSFSGRIEPLLKTRPEFSETPFDRMAHTNFYCLSWCPRAPGLNEIVFDLLDELVTGFGADAVHVGMDEVYYIADESCARCRGAKPAELFAAQVNALHQHIVERRGWQMLMWADRVIGPKYQGYSRYDLPSNDTSASIDLIPRDIVMCDWQYVWRREYKSIPLLASKGFAVWPSGFKPLKTAQHLSTWAYMNRTNNVLGYLATTWNDTAITNAHQYPPIKVILPQWR